MFVAQEKLFLTDSNVESVLQKVDDLRDPWVSCSEKLSFSTIDGFFFFFNRN